MKILDDEIENDLYNVEKFILLLIPVKFLFFSYLFYRWMMKRLKTTTSVGYSSGAHCHTE